MISVIRPDLGDKLLSSVGDLFLKVGSTPTHPRKIPTDTLLR